MSKKNSKKTVPELRFRGFTDPWEQRQLGEVVSERNILRSKGAGYPLVSFTVKDGVTPKTERYDREQLVIGDTSKKLYKETRLDDIVYNPANLKFGAIARNKYGNAVFSPIYITLEACPSVVSPAFVEMLVTRRDFINRALKYQQGTVYERMAVSVEDLVKMNIRVPSLPEQRRIGGFFSTLDSLIAAAERQEALLRQKKQAYLQLMFPQEGETQPRLRFNGVSGEWESLQLGKLYEKNTERNGNQFDAGKTLSVSSMTFNAFGNGAAKESLTTYKVLRIGDAAFEGHTSNEFAFGRFVVNTIGDGIMSPRFTAIRPTARWRQSCDLDFWSCYLHDENVMKRILVRSTKRGTMMNELVLDDFFTERIRVPSLPEQRRIGEFFSTLDNLIAAAENRAASLRALKFAYLQRMFV